VKHESLVGVLLLCGLSVGFVVGREFPRETLLEKECRVWAEDMVWKMRLSNPDHSLATPENPLASYEVPERFSAHDHSLFVPLLSSCMRGRQ
jgi:hypothetical protein